MWIGVKVCGASYQDSQPHWALHKMTSILTLSMLYSYIHTISCHRVILRTSNCTDPQDHCYRILCRVSTTICQLGSTYCVWPIYGFLYLSAGLRLPLVSVELLEWSLAVWSYSGGHCRFCAGLHKWLCFCASLLYNYWSSRSVKSSKASTHLDCQSPPILVTLTSFMLPITCDYNSCSFAVTY